MTGFFRAKVGATDTCFRPRLCKNVLEQVLRSESVKKSRYYRILDLCLLSKPRQVYIAERTIKPRLHFYTA